MPNPRGVNQWTKGGAGKKKPTKSIFRKNGKVGKALAQAAGKTSTSGPKAQAFKKQFGRNPKSGEKAFGK